MSPQAVDQQPSSVTPDGTVPLAPTVPGLLAQGTRARNDVAVRPSRTFPGRTGRGLTTERLIGLSIGVAVILTGVGIAAGLGAAVVLGVVIGVAAAFVVASRGVGEGKAR